MLKALAFSLGFAAIAHSPTLSAALVPTLSAVVAAEVAYVASRVVRKRVRHS